MPSYDFQCIECGERATKFMSIETYSTERDSIVCECGQPMTRQYDVPMIDRHVPGFYGSGRGHHVVEIILLAIVVFWWTVGVSYLVEHGFR